VSETFLYKTAFRSLLDKLAIVLALLLETIKDMKKMTTNTKEMTIVGSLWLFMNNKGFMEKLLFLGFEI